MPIQAAVPDGTDEFRMAGVGDPVRVAAHPFTGGGRGPWHSLARLRAILAGGFWGGLLDCFYCLSLWVSLPLALLIGADWPERLALWPALSAGAILLERVTASSAERQPAAYVEDEDDRDGMLR
jgi:hypothetical protein